LKIAILDSWFHWPPRGGSIRAVKEIADGLVERGVEVVLIVPNSGYRGAIDPKANLLFKVKKVGSFHFDGPRFYLECKEALDEIRPDAVLVANGNLLKPYMIMASRGYPTLLRLYAYEMLCLASFGVIYRQGHPCESDFIHSPWRCIFCPEYRHRVLNNSAGTEIGDNLRSYVFLTPLFHYLEKKSISQVSNFIMTTRYMAERFSPIFPKEKMTIIPDGVNTEIFTPKLTSSKDGINRISLLGRVSDPLKGSDILLRACSQLWPKRKDFMLTMTGVEKNQLRYPFLQQSGWRSEEDLSSVYQSSYMLVVPSIWNEPFGLTALEAMSCGVPVVASKVGGLPELVVDGETGLLFPPGDSSKLASKIEILLDDEDYARKLGRNAREYVLQNLSWPIIIDKYLVLLEKVISEAKDSRKIVQKSLFTF